MNDPFEQFTGKPLARAPVTKTVSTSEYDEVPLQEVIDRAQQYAYAYQRYPITPEQILVQVQLDLLETLDFEDAY